MSNKEIQNNKYYIDKEGYLQGIDIIKYPIARLEFSNANSFKPQAIVLHRTDSSTAKSTLDTWSNPNNAKVGTHFLIDKNGTIYQCASLYKYTQHVGDIRSKTELEKTWDIKEKALIENIWKEKASYGARKIKVSNYEKTKSYPNRYPINSDSIGIEVVGKYDNKAERYPNATTKQLETLEQLIIVLLELFNINKTDIYAHAKIAYKDKHSTEGVSLLEYIKEKL
ncbi:peptidoglycan recognition family protein [Helicobacter sp. MIT 05-5294]|uniref:N-acetylmuramoyl-L-alanine amidase n=1 Tax=Helicobacter sp. MIT 05-5294 TaxID=1548150 RepID=UPI001883988A|nr:peptidoglycan recognition family protein [Helicobacter sp. MIT 05-5294]